MASFLHIIPVTGSLINALAILTGGTVGLLLHSRFPKRLSDMAFQALGLITIFLGLTMAQKSSHLMILIFSLVGGSLLGELLDLEGLLERGSESLRKRLNLSENSFTEGFMASTLLFCIGSMAILGAIEEGLGGHPNLLIAKSLMDGISSIAFSSSLGVGVLFSAIPVFLYQGGLSIFAEVLQPILTPQLINEISAVGGLMLVGMGLTIMNIRKIRVTNMLPGILVAAILGYFLLPG